MQKGFDLLESGEFNAAENFFKPIYSEFPNNRTAALCYARAVGLSGNPLKAIEIFQILEKNHPEDPEIKLNLAEANLWNKTPESALEIYSELIKTQPNDFGINLGLANTFSILKNYDKALKFVNRSLEISPNNPNAVVSKKYIQLGRANNFFIDGNTNQATAILSKLLEKYQNDKDVLLSLINIKIATNQLSIAKDLGNKFNRNTEDSLYYQTSNSLISYIEGREKQSLKQAKRSFRHVDSVKNNDLKATILERYIQSLIWNRKFEQAAMQLEIDKINLKNEQVFNLQISLSIAKKDWRKALNLVDSLLENDPTSINAKTLKASILKGLNKPKEAIEQLEEVFKTSPNNLEATKLKKAIEGQYQPKIEVSSSVISDNGGNSSITYDVLGKLHLNSTLSSGLRYSQITTMNRESSKASFERMNLELKQIISSKITGKLDLGLGMSRFSEILKKNFNYDASLNLALFKNQTLQIGTSKRTETFNADLIASDLNISSIYLIHSFNPNPIFGSYIQLRRNTLSDKNESHSGFISAYTTISKKLGLKTGMNYQFLSFETSNPNLYFSPESFNSFEIFAAITKDGRSQKDLYYNISATIGTQKDSFNGNMLSYRIQGNIGYKFSKRIGGELFGNYTNIASASATGFQFNQMGIRINYFPSPNKKFN